MSPRRLATIARAEVVFQTRRPLLWIWIVLLALFAWGMSEGAVQISTGDSSVGGTKAWVTSEFSQAYQMAAMGLLFYAFFVAVCSGMSVLRDGELQVLELLRATPLSTAEYVWGKLGGQALVFALVALVHAAANAFCNHVLVRGETREIIGPFAVWSYLGPLLLFLAPTVVLVAGWAFALGALFRRPILVFFLPVLLLLVDGFFVWSWAPHWLPLRWDRFLMAIDPTGLRWLQRTWLAVDRGVDFYNRQPVGLDALFVWSRAAFLGLGLGAVVWTQATLDRRLRGSRTARAARAASAPAASAPRPAGERAALAALGMRVARPGFLGGLWTTVRAELRELRSSPGLYLFAPLILAQTIGAATARVGAFDTPLIQTSGLLAAASFNTLSVLLALLLLFYTVESLERDRATRMDALVRASPAPTAALLLGKALANSLVGAAILASALLGALVVIALDGRARFEPRPFLVLWGLLLVPTLLAWTSFTTALWCVLRSRLTTYAAALGVLVLTFYRQFTGETSWVGNWMLWDAGVWSDMAPLELDRRAYVVNRLLALALAAFFTALAVRACPRRASDAAGVFARLRPGRLLRTAGALAVWALPAALLASWLAILVRDGRGGSAWEKRARDTWTANLMTWNDVRQPQIVGVDLDLELEPAAGAFRTRGTYVLENAEPAPFARIAFTTGPAWEEVSWTLDGEPFETEHKTLLHVFRLPRPLAPGARLELGFDCRGTVPGGVSKNGPRASEMILESGVVLTSFTPSFLPIPGFVATLGADEEHPPEPRDWPEDSWEGETRSGFGVDRPFPARVVVHGPAELDYHSVGVRVSDVVADGRRTVEWRTDRPVLFLNVVAGRWQTSRGEGVSVHHHPDHAWNVPEMTAALADARRWYGAWFSPFPWQELKLSEFPGYDGYAQGFPTNITFSESIGFLARGDERADAPFLVTAHEAAHQWWGNRLVPGEGPGGDILSEGMSHFSTILLFDQVKGPGPRIAFCEGIEDRYAERRQRDSERPLVRIDGSRAGDQTVTYDKGGWVFWMLLQLLGRENALAGYRAFLERYETSTDHPLLQDLVLALRPFAPDPEAYDAFTRQWFFEVVLPEYELADATREALEGGRWRVRATLANKGTGRMPVEVAATRGERFPEPLADAQEGAAVLAADAPGAGWRESRARVVLGAGESAPLEILCDFEPERLIVDPDALVLQLERKKARREL